MKEITEQNYKDLEFNFDGIVVAYPKVDLYFNAEFYFIKQKIDYKTDKRYYIMSGYNEEDCTCNGLSPDRLKTNIENVFNCFSQMNYYQFENMQEFCNWYIHKDDRIKESINKFVEEVKDSPLKSVELPDDLKEQLEDQANPVLTYYKHGDGSENNLYTPDEIRDKLNPGWNTRREKLQDVLRLLELRDMKANTLEMLTDKMDNSKREYLLKQLERDEKRIEDFLNEKVV